MLITSSYNSPIRLPNGHIETIYPYFIRNQKRPNYLRERLELDDGDFLDLDWLKKGSQKKRLTIISHGLEGSSNSSYISILARILVKNDHDVLAWNCRGCSGETNRLRRTYHSGVSEDLKSVVQHAIRKNYDEIYLIGFSMGGNITLKFLGEEKDDLDHSIRKAIAISAPICLASSAKSLTKGISNLYMQWILFSLISKMRQKNKQFVDFQVPIHKLLLLNTFKAFDDNITAPLNGFKNAEDYWYKASSISKLDQIAIPTLIINAANDPFLAEKCYPVSQLKMHPFVDLEIPKHGGHVGFLDRSSTRFWIPDRALEYINS